MMITNIEVFQSKKNKQWYWRAKARNSKIVAVSGEGYTRKGRARIAAMMIAWRFRNHEVQITTLAKPQ